MFTLSYAWHGIVLNDYERMNYPKALFLIFSALAYIILGFLIVKMIKMHILRSLLLSHKVVKGVLTGMICGLIFFVIVTIFGLSFSKVLNVKNLVFDLAWQMIEQGIGGGVVSAVYLFTRVF